MKIIKIISAIHLIAEREGKTFALFVKVALPLGMFICFLLMLIAFFTGSTSDGVIGLLGVFFFGGGGVYLCKGGKYVPQKTFFLYRLTKEGAKKYYKWMLISTIIFCVVILMIDPHKFLNCLFPLITYVLFVYYMNKTIQVHEDVDYVANAQFANFIGLEVDEKINASYQNFNSSKSSKIKKNSNIILVSDRKLFFAYFNGNKWVSTIRKLEEIEKIGIYGGVNSALTYWTVIFTDGTKIGLTLFLLDKLTSKPNLFIKRFLETIDAYLLGYSTNTRNSRRRVSIDNTAQVKSDAAQPPETRKNITAEAPVTRKIDISDSILNDIKQGVSVEPGRNIEL
jgi:hypothetical protein